jgi:putative transcriptional regulator
MTDGMPGECDIKPPLRVNVKDLRTVMGLSQIQFARRFGFTLATLRQWEQDRRLPSASARALLAVIAYNPGVVIQALANYAQPVPEQRRV